MTQGTALILVFLLAFDAGLLLCYFWLEYDITGIIARMFVRRRDKPEHVTTGIVGSVLGFSAKALRVGFGEDKP